jgi:hypothetical protein
MGSYTIYIVVFSIYFTQNMFLLFAFVFVAMGGGCVNKEGIGLPSPHH